ncbi:unnamed protein product [Ophioblennius macclurei]
MELSQLCDDQCPQQPLGCPSSLPPTKDLQDPTSDRRCPPASVQHRSQFSAQSPPWAFGSSPSPHHIHDDNDDVHNHQSSCFYQLHMQGGSFVSSGTDCGEAGGGGGGGGGVGVSHRLQVEFSLPSTSPSSSAVLPSHFQVLGSLLHPSPVQQPRFLTQ